MPTLIVTVTILYRRMGPLHVVTVAMDVKDKHLVVLAVPVFMKYDAALMCNWMVTSNVMSAKYGVSLSSCLSAKVMKDVCTKPPFKKPPILVPQMVLVSVLWLNLKPIALLVLVANMTVT